MEIKDSKIFEIQTLLRRKKESLSSIKFYQERLKEETKKIEEFDEKLLKLITCRG